MRTVFACPCCGYRTLPERPGTSAVSCDVCAWEDRDPEGSWFGNPRHGLAEAQRSFRATGSCDPALAELARAPRPEEARPPWWQFLDDMPAAYAADIELAFGDVELAGGVSFAEAELIDAYALPARTVTDPPPPGHGSGPPWQKLTIEDLDRYGWGNFAFQDARGIRYHLPAFMRAHLLGPTVPQAIDSLLYTLASGHQLDALHALLTEPQRRAVAQYLAYVGDRALRGIWGAHLDPEQVALAT